MATAKVDVAGLDWPYVSSPSGYKIPQWPAGLLVAVVLLVTIAPTGPSSTSASPTPRAGPMPHLNELTAPRAATPATDARTLGASSIPVNGSVPIWANLSATVVGSPPGRSFGTATVYDPIDQYALIFGGYTNRHVYLGDTWAYTRGRWTNLSPAISPPPRDHASLAFDARDGYVLLFGGSNLTKSFNDTWKFVGGAWTNITPTVAPTPRWAASMGYDPRDREVVLYGGCLNSELSDTWTFAGGTWVRLSPTSAPAGRGGAAFAYDPADGFMTLFGGDNGTLLYNDTWWFANGTWSQVLPPLSPSARHGAAFAFDVTLQQMVLFGGTGTLGLVNDTWWFVHRTWRAETPARSPSLREFAMMSNDSGDGYLILFGGAGPGNVLLNDTWAYDAIATNAAAVPVGGLAPLNVSFTEATFNGFTPFAPVWSFGDGAQAPGTVATHQYQYGGAYRPSLTVTDRFGAQSTSVLTINVAGPLNGTFSVATIALPPTGVAPLNVTFSGVASSGDAPYHYLWSFGDGTLSASNLTWHVYARTGSFTARFTAWDAFNTTTSRAVPVVVVAPVQLNYTAAATVASAPFDLTVRAMLSGGFPPYSVNWSWGDGGFAAGANASHLFARAAVYTVTVSALDSHQDPAVRTFTVTVNAASNGGANPVNALLGGPGGIAIAVLAGAFGGAIVVRALGRRMAPPEPKVPGPSTENEGLNAG
ncbi:MAG: PKD domain-containing protein [Thermoplasmata archaeon]|nr:PKD domain-containing protein [Thermoplasmata archaeon]